MARSQSRTIVAGADLGQYTETCTGLHRQTLCPMQACLDAQLDRRRVGAAPLLLFAEVALGCLRPDPKDRCAALPVLHSEMSRRLWTLAGSLLQPAGVTIC